MQIVIDIPDGYVKVIKANQRTEGSAMDKMIRQAVIDGTPLPKGHGKLFDVNDILDRIGLEDNDANREENVGEIVTLEDFDYIPTIIPADTESGGEK